MSSARAARLETLAVFRKADEAYKPYSCPASGECCQLQKTNREPWLYPSEWQVLRDAVDALPETRADGGCPFLDAEGKRCTVYASRPFGCRTFFCERIRGPKRQPAAEVDALIRRLDSLNREAFEDADPKPLREWIRGERDSASRQP
ncbi:MAG: YkgJ family cysteine cluster protein [Myxococcaceae bacterium]